MSYLIENISIDVNIEGKLISSDVISVNISYSKGSQSSAEIAFLPTGNNALYYLNEPEFDESNIGKEITIKDKNKLIFKGYIVGSSFVRTSDTTQYIVSCMGGPLALTQTTVASVGWHPHGLWCDADLGAYVEFGLSTMTAESPLDFLRIALSMGKKLYNKYANEKYVSEAAKFAEVAFDQLLKSAREIKEANILKQFFGIIGEKDAILEYGITSIVQRMIDQGSSSTWWQFLLELCEMIGAEVIPWIDQTIIIPNMLFTHAIKNNVVFPCMLNSLNVNNTPFAHPDQIIVPLIWTENVISNIREEPTFDKNCIVYPKDAPNKNSPFQAHSVKLIDPPAWAERVAQWWNRHGGAGTYWNSNSAHTDEEDFTGAAGYMGALWPSYVKNFAAYEYKRIQFQDRRANFTCIFNYKMCPGFGCYIIDGETGYNAWGVLDSVNHNITENGAQTSGSLSYVTTFKTVAEQEIESPIYKQLIPGGADVGELIGATHVSPEEVISRVNYDAAEAAKYVGRL